MNRKWTRTKMQHSCFSLFRPRKTKLQMWKQSVCNILPVFSQQQICFTVFTLTTETAHGAREPWCSFCSSVLLKIWIKSLVRWRKAIDGTVRAGRWETKTTTTTKTCFQSHFEELFPKAALRKNTPTAEEKMFTAKFKPLMFCFVDLNITSVCLWIVAHTKYHLSVCLHEPPVEQQKWAQSGFHSCTAKMTIYFPWLLDINVVYCFLLLLVWY